MVEGPLVVDTLESPVIQVVVAIHFVESGVLGDASTSWDAVHLVFVEDGDSGTTLEKSVYDFHVMEPVTFSIESEEPSPSTFNLGLEKFTLVEAIQARPSTAVVQALFGESIGLDEDAS